MYTAFYGLREKPFALSPDPRFLYLAGSHREALAHLLYGIEQGEGFISITGEVGTGKTTLCRTMLERLDGDTEVAFLFNPSRTALELLQSICAELGLPAEGLARRTLMHQLNGFLLEQKRRGRRVLLIIDEAQTLSENTLEQVRLLSNLETSRDKLIQILLLGQPELDRKLDERGLRQLRQRISVRWTLAPLGPQETRAYVRHRLAVAAGEPKDLFSEAALREVHRRSGGVPRLVNQLCDRALLAGYAARAAQIGPGLVRAAAREIPDAARPRRGGESGGSRRRLWRPWMAFGASLAVVGLSLFAGMQVGRSGLSESLRGALPDWASGGPAPAPGATAPPRVGARDGLPAVGANAPNGPGSPWTPGGPAAGDARILRLPPGSDGDAIEGPTLAELVGYLPTELRPATEDRLLAPLRAPLAPDRASEDTAVAAPPPPEETALAPGLLGRLLATRDPRAAISESRTALLERFGRRVPQLGPPPADAAALQQVFEGRGLATTAFDGGSIALLRRLDHPVALPLAPPSTPAARSAAASATASARPSSSAGSPSPAASHASTEPLWIAVLGFEGERARVAGLVAGRDATVPITELEAHWLETGLIVWERFEPVPELLAEDAEGRGVLWLQRALAELRFLDGLPTGRFDAPTRSAVARFQRDRGLVADGVAGPLTQIALYGQLTRYPVPRLSSRAPAGPTASAPAPPDAAASTRASADTSGRASAPDAPNAPAASAGRSEDRG